MRAPGLRVPVAPGPDGSTPERDGCVGSMPGPNSKKPSSLNILANLNNKRKASDMEETGNIYDATHIRSQIKQEPGLPINGSQVHGGRSSLTAVLIKHEPGPDEVLQGRDDDNDNSRENVSTPSSGLGDSLLMVKEEANSPDHDSKEASEVEDRVSSSDLTDLDVWDVSGSEFHTSEAEEEDSSDAESAESAFLPGMERHESGGQSSRGHETRYERGSDKIRSRRDVAQDHDSTSGKRRNELTVSGSDETERGSPTRSVPHDQDSRARDESNELPGNEARNNKTTVQGKPRQRAVAKNHISARDISRSWKTANPADKMLMKMKERGCDWLEIRKAWQELTGEWPAQSTLPNRYTRVKDNLTRMNPGDGQRLLDAAADVEAQFQRAKWRLIAEAVESAGGAKYSNAFIQKKYDELARNPGMHGSLIDDESSDASESDTVPPEDNVARLPRQGAVSTIARAQARSEKPHVSSHADPAQSGTASGFGTPILGDDESPGSGHRRKRRKPSGPKLAVSHEEAKYMARHKALNASNRVKSWEVIAQECGITAPLNDITQALERVGYMAAHGSAHEADPDISARVSGSWEKRQARGTNGPHGGAQEESTISKHARKGADSSVPVDQRRLTTMTRLQGHGNSQLPTERHGPDQLEKGFQPALMSENGSISESSPDRNKTVQAKKKTLAVFVPQDARSTYGGKHHRQFRPYECKYCLGKYRKRSGLAAHWKRNPGCDPQMRRSKAAKTVPKETAAEWAPGTSKNAGVAGGLPRAAGTRTIVEISSKEPTPEIGG